MFHDPACSTFRKILIASVFGVGVCLIPHGVQSATSNSATLQWAANQESDLAGYRVYHGTTAGSYGPSQDAGKTTTYQFTNLESNSTHYFSITAYDKSGNESSPSQEVSTIIQPLALPALTSPESNSTLEGSTATFTWKPNETPVIDWVFYWGSVGGNDLYDSGILGSGTTNATITELPTDGRQLWVQLWYKLDSGWKKLDYQFTAAARISSSFPLTITKSGSGSGTIISNPVALDCGNICTASFSTESPITLSANAAPGSIFSGWEGACTGTGSCVVALSSSSASVSATFATIQTVSRSLSVSVTGDGNGSVTSSPSGLICSGGTCNASFPQGTTVTLTPTMPSGNVFQGWNGVCSGTSNCAVTLSSSQVVTATFASENSEPPLPKPNLPIFVNFQPTASQVPTNFKKDDGSVFTNTRGYGWNKLLKGTEQNSTADQTLDTFVSVTNLNPGTWSFAIPNGIYYVTMVLGDPKNAQGPHWVSVEGLQLAKQVATGIGEYLTIVDYPVEVKDLTLSLTLGNSGQGQTTLNYLAINEKPNLSNTTQTLTQSFGTTLVTSVLNPGEATKINPVVLVKNDKDEKELKEKAVAQKLQEQEAAAVAQAQVKKQKEQEAAAVAQAQVKKQKEQEAAAVAQAQVKKQREQEAIVLAQARVKKQKDHEMATLNEIKEKIVSQRNSGGTVSLRNLFGR